MEHFGTLFLGSHLLFKGSTTLYETMTLVRQIGKEETVGQGTYGTSLGDVRCKSGATR